ncbi:MAG: MoaD/ThiS family protein [Brevundimonas sp.]|nr:MoaD/ThiS family protein [Brevundimonas sp.]
MKLFGTLGDIAGWSEATLDGTTLGEIKAATAGNNALLAEHLDHRSTLVILNTTLTPLSLRNDDLPIASDDEVAFGSPVGGG